MRFVAFISLIFLSPLVSWYILAGMTILYIYFFAGYELIVIAIFIDSYFGATYAIPYYTIILSFLLLGAEVLKPYLLIYSKK